MKRRWGLLVVAGVMVLAARPTFGQQENERVRRANRARSLDAAPTFQGATSMDRPRLGEQADTYRGFRTRVEQLREMLKLRGSREWMSSNRMPPSPIRQMLDRGNLLGARSPMARQVASSATKEPVLYHGWREGDGLPPAAAAGVGIGPQPTLGAQTTGDAGKLSHGDAQELRIHRRADDYFEMGAAYFRGGDLRMARNCFELDKQIHGDQARPYVAAMLTFNQKQDFNQAYVSLLIGIQRAKTADDLRLDILKFYKEQKEFDRAVDASSGNMQNNPTNSMGQLILAQLAWMNGDLVTAITAAEAAEKYNKDADATEKYKKFHDLMASARTTSPTTRPGS